jgi:hypothetical protein
MIHIPQEIFVSELDMLKVVVVGCEFLKWLANERPEYGISEKLISDITFTDDDKKLIKKILKEPLINGPNSMKYVLSSEQKEFDIVRGYTMNAFYLSTPLFGSEFLNLNLYGIQDSTISNRYFKTDIIIKVVQYSLPWWARFEEWLAPTESGFDKIGKSDNFVMGLSFFGEHSDYEKYESSRVDLFKNYDARLRESIITMLRQNMGLLNQ